MLQRVAGGNDKELRLSYGVVQVKCLAVCCSVLQCVAVCCGVLQCVAVYCGVLQSVAEGCSVLQRVAACCRWEQQGGAPMCALPCRSCLQHAATHYVAHTCPAQRCAPLSERQGSAPTLRRSSVLQCAAVCYSVLWWVAVCCSVLQCVAVCCSVLQAATAGGYAHPM